MAVIASRTNHTVPLRDDSHGEATTTWNDLPMEVLVRIAKETIIPSTPFSIREGNAPLDRVAMTFGAIDKTSCVAFFDAIRQDCVFITVRLKTSDLSNDNPGFVSVFREIFLSRRAETLMNASTHTGFECSSIILNLYESKDLSGDDVGEFVICASDWNIMFLNGWLVAVLGMTSCYNGLVINASITRPSSRHKVLAILTEMADVSRGIDYVEMHVSPDPSSAVPVTSRLCAQLMQKRTHHVMLSYHAKHLQTLRGSTRNISSLLDISLVIALEHFAYFQDFEVSTYIDPQVAVQRCMYIALVFRGLSVFLFNNPNTREGQSNPMLKDLSTGDIILEGCLICCDTLLRSTRGWDHLKESEDGNNLFLSMISMLQSRAEYELAVARTALVPGKAISTHVWRGKHHREGKLDAKDHLRLAGEVKDFLSKIVGSDHYEQTGMSSHKEALDRWLSNFETVVEEIRGGIPNRKSLLKHGGLLEPMHHAVDLLCAVSSTF